MAETAYYARCRERQTRRSLGLHLCYNASRYGILAEARGHDPQTLSSSHCLANRLGTLTDLASNFTSRRETESNR